VRIAFLGLPIAALLLHHDGHEIAWAGVCRKNALGTRRLRRTLGDRVTVVPVLDARSVQNAIKAAGAELLVSWYWVKRVPRAVLGMFPKGAVGVHPSLLPRHRGPDPFFWAIDAGDAATGVTAHRLEEEYDTGAILAQRRVAIDPSWNAWTLAKRLDRPSLALLREVVGAFARGEPPQERAQDAALATDAPAPTEDALELDWSAPTERVLRRIRAAAPWPGAYTFLGDEAVTVTRARAAQRFPRVLAPGEGVVTDHNVALVRTADGAVELLEGRVEDEEGDEERLDAAALAEIMAKTRPPL
jgi:methionyl-tRNA formyltransferase